MFKIQKKNKYLNHQKNSFEKNNQMKQLIGYGSKFILKFLNQNEYCYYVDVNLINDNKKFFARIYIFEDIPENIIYISKQMEIYLQFSIKVDISKFDCQIIEYQENSILNFFPNIKQAEEIKICLVMTKEIQKYIKQITLQNLMQTLTPFIFFNGMQISISVPYQVLNIDSKTGFLNIIYLVYLDSSDYQIFIPKKTNALNINNQVNQYTKQKLKFNQLFINYTQQPTIKHVLKTMKKQISNSFILLYGNKGSGKKNILKLLCKKYYLNYIEKDSELIQNIDELKNFIKNSIKIFPVLINLRNFKSCYFQEKDLKNYLQFLKQYFLEQLQIAQNQKKLILVLSCKQFQIADPDDNSIKNYFESVTSIPNINEQEYKAILITFLTSKNIQFDEEDLQYITDKNFKQKNIFKTIQQLSDISNLNKNMYFKDLENQKTSDNSKVGFSDIGGLQNAKIEIIKTILLPTLYPQIFNSQLKPRTGLLFYGPPGTGKTLLARCIASQCKMSFLSIKGPELLNMYIGESEKNIRQLFEKARTQAPTILFFDELDSLIPARGKGSDSSNVMDRIVAQFLTEMDDIDMQKMVFVIGATNRPDLLDQSLLRPGRFDKKVYLGISEDSNTRIQILKAQLRKFSYNFDEVEIEKQIPLNFSGADFYGIVQEAVMISAKKQIKMIEQMYEERENEGQTFKQYVEQLVIMDNKFATIIIDKESILTAVQKSIPSVSISEIQKYKELQKQFQN